MRLESWCDRGRGSTARLISDDLDCLVPTSVGLPPSGSGALAGRTFVVKDNVALAGHASSYGMPRWRDTHDASPSSATAVERLSAAGAELVGLTKLDSLAYSLIGNAGEGRAPHNPRYPDRFTGGSSSGSAAAVAGGLADLGIGTDTGGSIRVPAAACGLCSLRPTHGSIDVGGVLPLAPSFDTVGVLAREPSLLRDAYGTLCSRSDEMSAGLPTEVLVAADTVDWISADAANALVKASELVASRVGVAYQTSDLGLLTTNDVAQRFARLQGRELWAHHGAWVERNLDCFIDEVRVRLERCRSVSDAPAAEQAADQDAWQAYRRAFGQLVGPGTCVVMPILHDLPPGRTASDDELVAFRSTCFRLTAPSSLAGAPEVVIPVHHDRSGNTYGIGLLGAPGADRWLLDVAVRICRDGPLEV
jgi:amidase